MSGPKRQSNFSDEPQPGRPKRRKQEVVDLTNANTDENGVDISLLTNTRQPPIPRRGNRNAQLPKSRQSSPPETLPTSEPPPSHDPTPLTRLQRSRQPPTLPTRVFPTRTLPELSEGPSDHEPTRRPSRNRTSSYGGGSSGRDHHQRTPMEDFDLSWEDLDDSPRTTRSRAAATNNQRTSAALLPRLPSPPPSDEFHFHHTTTGPRRPRTAATNRNWMAPGSFVEAMAEAIASGMGMPGLPPMPSRPSPPAAAHHHREHRQQREDELFGSLCSDLAALHQAVAGARTGLLPPHLLFSDRDFDETDYEMLLALDDRVESKHGAGTDKIDKIELQRVPRGGPEPPMACPICLEDVRGGEYLRNLGCNHKFHKHCVDRWLKSKAVCPICREGI